MPSSSDPPVPAVTEANLIEWLRFAYLELSPQKARTVLSRFGGSPVQLFEEGVGVLRERCPDLTERQLSRFSEAAKRDFDKDLQTLLRLGAKILHHTDPDYPNSLAQIPDAPVILFVRGSTSQDDRFSIAIVGSRRATSYGLSLAGHYARELSKHKLAIVSGGARGVDTRAHAGAIEAAGRTIAFIGSGLDVTYPAENKKLFENIVESGGAIASEYAIGSRPEPWRFPARNRLISGISLGVLVLESPVDSGSLITARLAGEQGREVFAIPGPIDTGRSAGCHKLIQDGAKLVQCPEDILDELGLLTLRSPDGAEARNSAAIRDLPPMEAKILNMLTLEQRTTDSLIVESGFTAPQVTGILTLLEMRGLARRVPGNAFVRVL
jgi:DNA processing protein